MTERTFIYFTQWDRSRFTQGLRLVDTFVKGVEKDCAAAIREYEEESHHVRKKVKYPWRGNIVGKFDQDEDDAMWDLDALNRVYFPTLRRGSALAMVCSFFEHELNLLCEEVKRFHGLAIAAIDLHGQGVERAMNFLKLCGGVDTSMEAPSWQAIKHAYVLRNALIHAGGQATKEPVRRYVLANEFLDLDHDDIVIREGYLAALIDAMRTYAFQLGDGLRERFASSPPTADELCELAPHPASRW